MAHPHTDLTLLTGLLNGFIGVDASRSVIAWLNRKNRVRIAGILSAFAAAFVISKHASPIPALILRLYRLFLRLFTSKVSVRPYDRLAMDIIKWLTNNVVASQNARSLTAVSHTARSQTSTADLSVIYEDRVTVHYNEQLSSTWFFYNKRLFLVEFPTSQALSMYSDRHGEKPRNLNIMCLAFSANPIKEFIQACRSPEKTTSKGKPKTEVEVTYASRPCCDWDRVFQKPARPLNTIHLEESIKQDLVADIKTYLDPRTRHYYNTHGIPYRRGYLLYGPPGTGKTSLAIALAGFFDIPLYVLSLPSVANDDALDMLFSGLIPRCLITLEDVDAVGLTRDKTPEQRGDKDGVTVSGLLNVLDGISSGEGRIVFMTANQPEKLDKALIRPGRVDKMIYLGHITQESARQMFMRMFAPEAELPTTIPEASQEIPSPESQGAQEDREKEKEAQELEVRATEFSQQIPEAAITPAQLQGFLLAHRYDAAGATAHIAAWIEQQRRDVMDDFQQFEMVQARDVREAESDLRSS